VQQIEATKPGKDMKMKTQRRKSVSRPISGKEIFTTNGPTKRARQTLTRRFVTLVLLVQVLANGQESRVSELGQYQGYSAPVYFNWTRTSEYITVRDGTKLAIDLVRPVEPNGAVVQTPLPVIWTHERYHRGYWGGNRMIVQLDYFPWLQQVLRHGYVIAAVDVRGSGASYGTRTGPFAPEEAQDAHDITEWLAAQPWSNGKIGMYGGSYMGINQYFAASTAPPHLVAIFPEMAMFDLYSFVHPGGVFRHDFFSAWGDGVDALDTFTAGRPAPVDADNDESMLDEALTAHQANADVYKLFSGPRYRDSLGENDLMVYDERSPATCVEKIKESGVAVYHLAGWYDMWPRDAVTWFQNLDPNHPQKIIITPWHHSGTDDLALAAEHLRWYDYWLKGIDNGIMDEAPIHYYTMGAAPDQAWRSAWQWPLPEEQSTRIYFAGGPSGSVSSVNDGLLSLESPTDRNGRDDMTVDYTTTTGTATRWSNGYGGDFSYPDMTTNDEKGLTYTTLPLETDIELTGHPVVHLWVTSTAPDGDFMVYLEEVEESGSGRGDSTYESTYITEGTLRASHRALTDPPFRYEGLPYHRSFAEDAESLSDGEPVELVIDLHPTSNIFDAGHRLRVTITCADKDNLETPELLPAPTVNVYRDTEYASYIVVPVIPRDPGPDDEDN
jgi:uncharacterized protein